MGLIFAFYFKPRARTYVQATSVHDTTTHPMTKKHGRTNNADDDSSISPKKKHHEEEYGPHVIVRGDKVKVKRSVNAYILY
jgi:hypothetical protein